MTLHCRITKIEIEHFRVDLTSRSSDLQDKNAEFAPARDNFFDHNLHEKDQKKDEDTKKKSAQGKDHITKHHGRLKSIVVLSCQNGSFFKIPQETWAYWHTLLPNWVLPQNTTV